ncbi:hypothetical protein SPRG_20805, partial [Saprolegnia parasitica CBS 223.65]
WSRRDRPALLHARCRQPDELLRDAAGDDRGRDETAVSCGALPAARRGGGGRGRVAGPSTHCALGQRDASARVLGRLELCTSGRDQLTRRSKSRCTRHATALKPTTPAAVWYKSN